MFRTGISVLAVCITVLIATSGVLAAGGELLTNGAFTTDLSGWTASGAVTEDLTQGVPPGSATVSGTRWALLTQVVTQDRYNFASTSVQYDLKAYVKINGTEDITFKLGYFDGISFKPTATQTPDHLIVLGDTSAQTFGFVPIEFSGTINADPKYLSVRIEWNSNLNPGADCQGWVDQVSFKSFSNPPVNAPPVPEPASLMLGALGLGALAPLRRLRRK